MAESKDVDVFPSRVYTLAIQVLDNAPSLNTMRGFMRQFSVITHPSEIAVARFWADIVSDGSEAERETMFEIAEAVVQIARAHGEDLRPRERLKRIGAERLRDLQTSVFRRRQVPDAIVQLCAAEERPVITGSLAQSLASICRDILEHPDARRTLIRAFWIEALARGLGAAARDRLWEFGVEIERLAEGDVTFDPVAFRKAIGALDRNLGATPAILELADPALRISELRDIARELVRMIKICMIETGFILDSTPPPSGIAVQENEIEEFGPVSIRSRNGPPFTLTAAG